MKTYCLQCVSTLVTFERIVWQLREHLYKYIIVIEYIACFQSAFSSSLKGAFSGSKGRFAFDLNTALYQAINSKHKIVKGTLIARYSHQFWLMVNTSLPSVSWDVLKKPMPKMLLTREAGRKSIDKIWMYRSARLSWWEARAICVDSVAIRVDSVAIIRFTLRGSISETGPASKWDRCSQTSASRWFTIAKPSLTPILDLSL